MQIVYTVSTGYSGSTLLSMLMNAHPQIASIGELANSIGVLLKNSQNKAYPCSCRNDITQCTFWNQVQKQCQDHGVTLDLYDFQTQLNLGLGNKINRIVFGVPSKLQFMQSCRDFILDCIPFYSNTVNKTLDRNLIIARSILKVMGKNIFFDTSKNTRIASKLAERTDINFKLVHLVRDPRGVLNSKFKRNPNITAEYVGKHRLRINNGALNIKAALKDKSYILVNYESLCSDPRETIRNLCEFLGVEDIDLVESAMRNQHHLIGNDMRTAQLKNIKLDEAWCTNLSASQTSDI